MKVSQPLRASASEVFALVVCLGFLIVLPVPHTVTLRLVFLFLSVVVAGWRWYQGGTELPPLLLAFGLWLFAAAISLFSAVDFSYSLGEIKTEILYSFLAFFAFYVITRSRLEWNAFVVGILVVLLVLSVANIVLWYRTGGAQSQWFVYNGVGNFTAYFVTCFPLVVYTAMHLRGSRVQRIVARLAPFLFFIPVYFTQNRIVWVAVGLSIATFLLLALRSEVNARRKRRFITVTALIAVVAIAAFFQTVNDRMTERSTSIDQTLIVDLRPKLWRFAVERIVQHPVQGVGFGRGAFGRAFPEWPERKKMLFHAHNIFLDAGIQMGVLGILVMGFLLFAVGREFWRLYRSNNRELQWLGITGIAMLVGVITRNMTDELFQRDLALLFWAQTGMILGYAQYVLRRGSGK